jgi:hypothetical protein
MEGSLGSHADSGTLILACRKPLASKVGPAVPARFKLYGLPGSPIVNSRSYFT